MCRSIFEATYPAIRSGFPRTVWKDLESKNKDEPFFKVNGIETEPQVVIRALRTIYIAATELGCDLFWLDKQCVRQDKAT